MQWNSWYFSCYLVLEMRVIQKPRLRESVGNLGLAQRHSFEMRLDTFQFFPGRWPGSKDKPTAIELAFWGFVYDGRGDQVR